MPNLLSKMKMALNAAKYDHALIPYRWIMNKPDNVEIKEIVESGLPDGLWMSKDSVFHKLHGVPIDIVEFMDEPTLMCVDSKGFIVKVFLDREQEPTGIKYTGIVPQSAS